MHPVATFRTRRCTRTRPSPVSGAPRPSSHSSTACRSVRTRPDPFACMSCIASRRAPGLTAHVRAAWSSQWLGAPRVHAKRCAAPGASSAAADADPLTAPHGSGSPSAGTATADEAAPQVMAGKTVGVVGGGPGGMLCAAHLARLGAVVEVFEKSDPDAVTADPPAVWSIVLPAATTQVIEGAGISADFGPKWKAEGLASYRVGMPPRFQGRWVTGSSDSLVRGTQRGISAHLRAECERVYGDSVTVTTGMGAVGGDVCAGELILEDSAGERHEQRFDMVVGADGVHSTVRQLMQAQDEDMKVDVTHSVIGIVCNLIDSPGHPSTFATLATPSGTPFQGTPDGFEGPLEGCITEFVLPGPDTPPELGFCAISVRHGGREISTAITGDAQALRQLRSEDEIFRKLEATYPHMPTAWLRQTAATLHDRAVTDDVRVRTPTFVTCSKLASGRAVLLGDAAHAVSPNIGMGCATALKDSEVISRACIATGGSVEATGATYSDQWLDNAHMLTHVSRRIDAVQGFKYHKNIGKMLAGLPYFAANAAANQALGKVPGVLLPGFSISQIFRESQEWTVIKRNVRLYGLKLAAIALVATVAVCSAAWKILSLLPLPP